MSHSQYKVYMEEKSKKKECVTEAEAVKEGGGKFSVCACMFDMGCLCPQRESLSVCPRNLPIISPSQFFLPVLFLFIFLSPACICGSVECTVTRLAYQLSGPTVQIIHQSWGIGSVTAQVD